VSPLDLGAFQSLFSWMTLIGEIPISYRDARRHVSILVFLDDAHRPQIAWMLQYETARVSILVFLDDAHRRSHVIHSFPLGEAFQSLFSWMTLIGTLGLKDGEDTWEMFQSLFSWMTLIGAAVCSSAPWEKRCFNPCFLG